MQCRLEATRERVTGWVSTMARQLKRWESPRREGRNDKGRGGAARQRQRRKQFQALRKKLKEQSSDPNSPHSPPHPNSTNPGKPHRFPVFLGSEA